jgi:hypothetical protein
MGMSLAVYAAATGNPAIEVGAGLELLNALGYLHARGKDERKARAKAKSSPAYVLVKAKKLSEHEPGDPAMPQLMEAGSNERKHQARRACRMYQRSSR